MNLIQKSWSRNWKFLSQVMSRFEMCFREVYLTTLCRIRRARRYYRYCSQSCGESVDKCWGGSPNQCWQWKWKSKEVSYKIHFREEMYWTWKLIWQKEAGRRILVRGVQRPKPGYRTWITGRIVLLIKIGKLSGDIGQVWVLTQWAWSTTIRVGDHHLGTWPSPWDIATGGSNSVLSASFPCLWPLWDPGRFFFFLVKL